ncbi:shikimate dehydrogenase [Sporosarcina sp. CAU 1771]
MKKWYAVIGDPVGQSISPEMHDTWFSENGIDASYIPILVKEQELGEAIASLKKLGCSGWNVTVPHKTAIIPFLDEVDPSAKMMNAVNTVVVQLDGSLHGFNTDGEGFVRSLEETFPEYEKDGKLVVVGAGGAARGISFALDKAGYGPIAFANRTIERAQQIAVGLPNSSVVSIEEAEKSLAEFKLIVQTTSVGMEFAQKGTPIATENIQPGTIVADIIYNPLETELLLKAKKSEARTMNGIGMLVHQGAIAFEKWTGVRPDTEKMIGKMTVKLGGSYVNR